MNELMDRSELVRTAESLVECLKNQWDEDAFNHCVVLTSELHRKALKRVVYFRAALKVIAGRE